MHLLVECLMFSLLASGPSASRLEVVPYYNTDSVLSFYLHDSGIKRNTPTLGVGIAFVSYCIVIVLIKALLRPSLEENVSALRVRRHHCYHLKLHLLLLLLASFSFNRGTRTKESINTNSRPIR